MSDNGGPRSDVSWGSPANNFPLRGNKGSMWEGGTRTPAFVHSPSHLTKGEKLITLKIFIVEK